MRNSTTKRLTIEEAQRALYIDFEGREDHQPVLLGTTHWKPADRVHQYVTNSRYRPIGSTATIEVLTFADSIERILQRAEKNDRLIVAWTTHELRLVERYAPEHLGRFKPRYRNALTIAKYWRNAHHAGEKPGYGSLANYLELIGYVVPERAGRHRTATTITRVDKSLDRDPSGQFVTADQWTRWQDVLDHNAHDCAGMRAICIKAAADVEAGQSHP